MVKLTSIITEADEERQRQRKEYDAVVNERDILGQQLIKRNQELSTLYEKIKIQRSTLRKGESQYNNILAKIGALHRSVGTKSSTLATLRGEVGDQDRLKKEIYKLEKDLLAERTKINALHIEMERPLNVHRWRKLKGSDPARYKLICKVQKLQKQLIKKTEEVVEKDLLIQETEKLYVELKNILSRQPGPEVAEQLTVYQSNLKEKHKQMRAMNSELEMYKAQVNEYKYEIERLNGDMKHIKEEYFKRMRQIRNNNSPMGGDLSGALPGEIYDESVVRTSKSPTTSALSENHIFPLESLDQNKLDHSEIPNLGENEDIVEMKSEESKM